VNRDFSAALNMSRCAMMEKRPQEWTKVIIVVENPKWHYMRKTWRQ
jgi:hypothetical protein